MCLSPDIRGIFRRLVKKGLTATRIAYLFDSTRQTVYRWLIRGRHAGREFFKDRHREHRASKVTNEVELSILTMRNMSGERHAYNKALYIAASLSYLLFS